MASSSEFAVLLDFGMATIAALGFSYVFSRLKLRVVLGQLVAGTIIGQLGLGLFRDLNTIDLLASLEVARQILFPVAGQSALIGSIIASLGLRLGSPRPNRAVQVARSPAGRANPPAEW